MKIKWIQNIKWRFQWVPVLWSPFVFPKFKWYLGEIAMGTPYFLPRKWVKKTEEDILQEWEEFQVKLEELKSKPRATPYSLTADQYIKAQWGSDFTLFREHRKTQRKSVLKKFGWDWISWGWKTKWDSYRHEWNPGFSFVFFGKQLSLCITPFPKDLGVREDCYWEAFLYWGDSKNPENYDIPKVNGKYARKPTVSERLEWLQKEDPCTWGHNEDGVYVYTNYYYDILKKRYHKYIMKPRITYGEKNYDETI